MSRLTVPITAKREYISAFGSAGWKIEAKTLGLEHEAADLNRGLEEMAYKIRRFFSPHSGTLDVYYEPISARAEATVDFREERSLFDFELKAGETKPEEGSDGR